MRWDGTSMGIYDRDYFQENESNSLWGMSSAGKVCKWLVWIHLGMFVFGQLVTQPQNWQAVGYGPVTESLALKPADVWHGQLWRVATYFLGFHPGGHWAFFFIDLVILWFLGAEVEQSRGSREFLFFYILAGIAGGAMVCLVHLLRPVPEHLLIMTPSASVTAVIVLALLQFRQQRHSAFTALPILVWILAAYPLLAEILTLTSGRSESPMGLVLLGTGGLFAFAYHHGQWRLAKFTLFPQRPRSRPNLRLFTPEQTKEPVPVGSPDLDEHLEAKVDAVLEKVARTGKDSLTDSEKQILLRASEIYRKKRS